MSASLAPQLITLDPTGPCRRPPPAVLEQLSQLNGQLRLGQLLCTSREPDFLLDILHRQGPNQSMPWLSDLVENNEGAFRCVARIRVRLIDPDTVLCLVGLEWFDELNAVLVSIFLFIDHAIAVLVVLFISLRGPFCNPAQIYFLFVTFY